jgi:hypothetical protein
MPGVSVDQIRCQLTGHILGSQTWSTSLWINTASGSTVPGQADLQGVANVVGPILDTFAAAIVTTAWTSNTTYDGNHFSFYPASAVRPARVSVRTPTAVSGTGSAYLPAFTALVASFRTAVPGRGGRGRSYLPLTSGTPMSGGQFQISSSAATIVANAYKAMIDSINSATFLAPFTSHRVAVRSSSIGTGIPITSVIVDSLPDAQHRREDKILPLYVISKDIA